MLRPERMSKVSVTGAKTVMDDVIEAVHDLNLVHLSNYDGSWEGFETGDPEEGADEASEKLVTVRSIQNKLGVDPDDAGPERLVADDLDAELERVRTETNDLDDRRDEIEDELREIEEELDRMGPLTSLGIPLHLLGGYDTLEVAVGQGDPDLVESAVATAEGIDAYDTETADDGRTAAVFARPAEGHEDVLDEALVGVAFDPIAVPDAEGDPSEHVDRLRSRKRQLESELTTVEEEIEDLRLDAAGFLLAAEEHLSIRVQKAEAPLRFATTRNSFVAEGWIPTERFGELESALTTAVGDHVELEELERASYQEGHPTDREPVGDSGVGGEPGEAVATDGGTSTVMPDDPPVILNNETPVEPFELLVNAAERPNYTEFDPTKIVFLTFPVFFGFMIGDFGYGLLYMGIGYYLYDRMEEPALNSLGGIALWAGAFTTIFGVLYGEIFGLHLLGEIVFEQGLGMKGPPLHKGLQPHYEQFATAWLVISMFVGLLHVGVGHGLGFLKTYFNHDLTHAVYENGSWLLMTFGVWIWIFSTHLEAKKPEFIFTIFSSGEEAAFALGFTGVPSVVGQVAIALAGLGVVLLAIGEGPLVAESLQALVNVLSYVRLMAVLLAKAGLAFVVNLLVFGAYVTDGHGEAPAGEYHFIFIEGTTPAKAAEHGEVMFAGLLNADGGVAMVVGVLAGLLLLVIGHLFVLALGVTSAGLQGIRLEYVEFFGKFYDGGGRRYDPFGYRREYTTED
ncbi:V-type ATP synthase subunit I [Halobacteriales archaeon QS_8_69_26]|nr:MAG: V-type ATP synthase subunit I [Halobacteriales archaeon QS_8_69_26]